MKYKEFIKRSEKIDLNEGAPGPEHERLKDELKEWAKEKGFAESDQKLSNNSMPDVLMIIPDEKFLFIGDAKDSKTENSKNKKTLERINKYIKEFQKLLNEYSGGYIAIATNDCDEAKKWINVLT